MVNTTTIEINARTLDKLIEQGVTRYRRRGFVFNALAIGTDDNVAIATVGKHRALIIPKYIVDILKSNGDVTTYSKTHGFKFVVA